MSGSRTSRGGRRETRDAPPVDARWSVGASRIDRVKAGANVPHEPIEIEVAARVRHEPRHAAVKHGARAAMIAVRQVLERDAHLDEALEALALGPRGAHPERLEPLVCLEVQSGVEQQCRLGQRHAEPHLGRVGGTIRERAVRAPGPLGHLLGVSRSDPRLLDARVACGQHTEGAASAEIVKRLLDQLGQTVAQEPRESHDGRSAVRGPHPGYAAAMAKPYRSTASPADPVRYTAPMLTRRKAQSRIRARIESAVPPEMIATACALRRVLAEDVRATIDVPAADNSAVDGYAVATSDIPAAG